MARVGFACWLAMVTLVAMRLGGASAAAAESKAATKSEVSIDRQVVDGKVVDAEGKPVAGAKVSLLHSQGRGWTEVQMVAGNAQGEFHLEGAVEKEDADPVQWFVLVEAAGYGLSPARVPVDGKCEVRLRKATEGKVVLTDEDGSPVAGVKVRPMRVIGGLSSRRSMVMTNRRTVEVGREARTDGTVEEEPTFYFDFPERFAASREQTSDAQGVCRFQGLPSGTRLKVTIEDERFAQPSIGEEVPLTATTAENVGKFTLIPAAVLEGTVRFAETGKPAAGIRVGAQTIALSTSWGEAVTDESGRYVMKQLRASIYNVALDLRGEWAANWTARAHEDKALAPGSRIQGVDFTLVKGATISGKITDVMTGDPLPGLPIGVYGPAHPKSSAWVQLAKTRRDGSYVLRVPTGAQYVYFQGVVPAGFRKPNPDSHEVTLADGENWEINFELGRE